MFDYQVKETASGSASSNATAANENMATFEQTASLHLSAFTRVSRAIAARAKNFSQTMRLAWSGKFVPKLWYLSLKVPIYKIAFWHDMQDGIMLKDLRRFFTRGLTLTYHEITFLNKSLRSKLDEEVKRLVKEILNIDSEQKHFVISMNMLIKQIFEFKEVIQFEQPPKNATPKDKLIWLQDSLDKIHDYLRFNSHSPLMNKISDWEQEYRRLSKGINEWADDRDIIKTAIMFYFHKLQKLERDAEDAEMFETVFDLTDNKNIFKFDIVSSRRKRGLKNKLPGVIFGASLIPGIWFGFAYLAKVIANFFGMVAITSLALSATSLILLPVTIGAGLVVPLFGAKYLTSSLYYGLLDYRSLDPKMAENFHYRKSFRGLIGNSLFLGLLGAAIGTLITPGIGTLIGAGLGLILGSSLSVLGLKNIGLFIQAFIKFIAEGIKIGYLFGFKPQLNHPLLITTVKKKAFLAKVLFAVPAIPSLLFGLVARALRDLAWGFKTGLIGGLFLGYAPFSKNPPLPIFKKLAIAEDLETWHTPQDAFFKLWRDHYRHGHYLSLATMASMGAFIGAISFIGRGLVDFCKGIVHGIIKGTVWGFRPISNYQEERKQITQHIASGNYCAIPSMGLFTVPSFLFGILVRGIRDVLFGIGYGLGTGVREGFEPLAKHKLIYDTWKDHRQRGNYLACVTMPFFALPSVFVGLISRGIRDIFRGLIQGFISGFLIGFQLLSGKLPENPWNALRLAWWEGLQKNHLALPMLPPSAIIGLVIGCLARVITDIIWGFGSGFWYGGKAGFAPLSHKTPFNSRLQKFKNKGNYIACAVMSITALPGFVMGFVARIIYDVFTLPLKLLRLFFTSGIEAKRGHFSGQKFFRNLAYALPLVNQVVSGLIKVPAFRFSVEALLPFKKALSINETDAKIIEGINTVLLNALIEIQCYGKQINVNNKLKLARPTALIGKDLLVEHAEAIVKAMQERLLDGKVVFEKGMDVTGSLADSLNKTLRDNRGKISAYKYRFFGSYELSDLSENDIVIQDKEVGYRLTYKLADDLLYVTFLCESAKITWPEPITYQKYTAIPAPAI